MTLPARPPGEHPRPEEILRALRSPDDPGSRPILTHAALCHACAVEEVAIEAFGSPEPIAARRLSAEWARFGRAVPRGRVLVFGVRPAVLALAASLLLLIGAAVVLERRPAEDTRGPASALQLLSPRGVLAEPPAEFDFVLPGPGRGRVMVFDASQTYLWKSEPVRSGRVEFPLAERSRLLPEVEYFWMVEAGGEVAPAQSFTIHPVDLAGDSADRAGP